LKCAEGAEQCVKQAKTSKAPCSGMEDSMSELGPGELADATWSFARLRYQPGEAWEEAAVARVRWAGTSQPGIGLDMF
jgi:hypothetical protein